ncbi:unnamed protein product [Meganyctiphanes norvegica]|uniref:Lipase n=1 Tax=Meganyctiphanes norvegica TaxID=48144 RepID=A0AAV2Q9V7_MEGNR
MQQYTSTPMPKHMLLKRISTHLTKSVAKVKIVTNTIDIALAAGYPCEEHLVQTADGYILTVHHIPPYIKTKQIDPNARVPKGVVFLQHGLVGASSQWITNDEKSSLGYLLSDAGYDVWMGNFRGNLYSRIHISLTIDDKDYWKFSWDEMAKYDLPAMLDYVLKQTHTTKLWYIGHSMGTTTLFALLSSQPEYQDRVAAMIALAPVATVKTIQSPVKYMAPLTKDIMEFLRTLGYDQDLLTSSRLRSLWEPSPSVNLPGVQTVAENVAFILSGLDADRVHKEMLPTILSQNPAGTSTQTLLHFGLNVKSGEFNMYDHGDAENLRLYGQKQPLTYDVTSINTPVYLIHSKNDWLTGEWDIQQLEKKLRNLKNSHQIEHPCFSHLDFLWARDAKCLVYDYVLDILNKSSI